jgi:soluble lytic murein transglycosylase-like protein
MRGATALLGIALGATAFGSEPPGAQEYAERCAGYYARQFDVSPALVRAIIQVESAWQPGVVSLRGAMGLMQLMPATAEHFGVTDPFYVHENVGGGVAYLAKLKRIFHGDLVKSGKPRYRDPAAEGSAVRQTRSGRQRSNYM